MEAEYSSETEQRIIEAATKIFVEKGRTGTSMQDIADEAGINRTLLNYYFRSKEKLFDLIFEKVFLRFIPEIAQLMTSEEPLKIKFDRFIDRYTAILLSSPLTPIFILHELAHSPEKLVETIKSKGIDPELTINQIEKEMEMGHVIKADPRQLLVSLLSLIIFPFAAKPIIKPIILGEDESEFKRFIEERKEFIKRTFLTSIIQES